MLQSDPTGGGPNAFRSIETARVHHASRRRGGGWPLAARAQQPAMPVIGFLGAVSPDGFTERVRAFRQGLKDDRLCRRRECRDRIPLGREPARPAAGAGGRSGSQAGCGHRRDGGTAPAIAAKAATTTIPIVFTVPEDPVKLGLVASLSRPGGNLTGVNFFVGELVPKRLELLRELVPGNDSCRRLRQSGQSCACGVAREEAESAGRAMGLQIQSSTPAPVATSMRPLQRLRASGPTRFSSARTPSSSSGGCNLPLWLHAMRSPRRFRRATLSKPAA